jgi:hypothetical protein
MKTADKEILNSLLDLTRRVLQPYPPLTVKQKKTIIQKSDIIKNQIQNITPIRKAKILSFIYILTGEHPIFESSRFLSPNVYHPLHPVTYNAYHRIHGNDEKTNIHGNNYLYTKTNLRNGVLFTYYDSETNSYIPITFNTNFPICMVAPDPFCTYGKSAEVIDRMLTYFFLISKKAKLKNFPLVFKGLDNETTNLISEKANSTKIEHDSDITTITAEMNYPALSYEINRLKKMVKTRLYDKQKNKKKPKIINVSKKLDALTYCEEWEFDQQATEYITRKWALSKIDRLKHRGMENVSCNYMMDTVIKSISERPPGERNKDFYTIAIKSKEKQDNIAEGQLLGVVIASRNNKTVAALNAVVIPVNKNFRDLGYYTVYKLAEKMSSYGIRSYWHGPKELESDVNAVKEFMGEPNKIEKKYCLKCRTERFTKIKNKDLQDSQFQSSLHPSL